MNLSRNNRHTGGFTLIEVLVAMSIFAVGFAALAAIFPPAVLLQKQTVDDATTQHVERNLTAMLTARGIAEGDLTAVPDDEVSPVPDTMLDTTWTMADRSYPSTTMPVFQRRVFWVPLVFRDTSGSEIAWRTYIFVMIGGTGANFDRNALGGSSATWANPNDGYYNDGDGDRWAVPGVRKVAVTPDATNDFRIVFSDAVLGVTVPVRDLLQAGDKILDNKGNDYTVMASGQDFLALNSPVSSDVDAIWFAMPSQPGRRNPAKLIATPSEVVR